MKDKFETIIGIDLGTTNSLVSFIRDGMPRIIPNERGSRSTPSVVSFKANNQVIVGEMARNQSVLNSDATVSNVKLAMGEDRYYRIHDYPYRPEEISGLILAYLKEYAENYLGCPVDQAVITVPAYFDDNQRRATLKAAAMTGLTVRKLLNEPTAAALTYGLSTDDDTNLLVIDLGGGTLDITLMEYRHKVFRVKGVGGSTAIGGVNFDQVIIDHILTEFAATSPYELRNDKVAYQQLVIHAEKAKIDLSSAEDTSIMIPYIAVTDQGPIHLNMNLTRTRFEELIAPIIEDIGKYISETFSQADLQPDWVDTVILVGGATRTPALQRLVDQNITTPPSEERGQRVADASGPNLRKNINPDEAVARGAAILAGILNGQVADLEFYDITAHALGIKEDDGGFAQLIPAAAAYPVEKVRLFTTVADDQQEVIIHVIQERGHADAKEYVSLGHFQLKINHGRKKGQPNIDVTFSIDQNGVLTVSAVDLDTGEAKDISIAEF